MNEQEPNKSEKAPVEPAKQVRSGDWVGHVWLVVGECGEYSDHTSWIVRGYRTEAEAEAHKEACQKVADELKRKYPNRSWQAAREGNPHDPQMQCDYTGTDYHVQMVEMGAWPTDPSSPTGSP